MRRIIDISRMYVEFLIKVNEDTSIHSLAYYGNGSVVA